MYGGDIFAKWRDREITFIGEGVKAQFDNTQQTPLGFQWRGRHYEVLKMLHSAKNPEGHLQYLLLTDGGIFSLALKREESKADLCRSRWFLNFRVKDEREANSNGPNFSSSSIEMKGLLQGKELSPISLVPLLLANVAYYHGHLCPELAVGYRAALVAQEELGFSRHNAHNFFIVAENMTSAIEALQLITGCTIGNQNFFAYDLGKHVYYFGSYATAQEPGKALRLALTNLVVDLSPKGELGRRLFSGEANREEQKEYQQAINDAVQKILHLAPQDLFTKTRISLQPPRAGGHLDYTCCSHCGEVTVRGKCHLLENGFVCPVCFAKAKM